MNSTSSKMRYLNGQAFLKLLLAKNVLVLSMLKYPMEFLLAFVFFMSTIIFTVGNQKNVLTICLFSFFFISCLLVLKNSIKNAVEDSFERRFLELKKDFVLMEKMRIDDEMGRLFDNIGNHKNSLEEPQSHHDSNCFCQSLKEINDNSCRLFKRFIKGNVTLNKIKSFYFEYRYVALPDIYFFGCARN